jgi:hypothetical protein
MICLLYKPYDFFFLLEEKDDRFFFLNLKFYKRYHRSETTTTMSSVSDLTKKDLRHLIEYIKTHDLRSALIEFCRVFNLAIPTQMKDNLVKCAKPSKNTYWPANGLLASVQELIPHVLIPLVLSYHSESEMVRLVREIASLLLASLNDFRNQSKEAYTLAFGRPPPNIVLVERPPTPTPRPPVGQVA